jgi:hypothetical protein
VEVDLRNRAARHREEELRRSHRVRTLAERHNAGRARRTAAVPHSPAVRGAAHRGLAQHHTAARHNLEEVPARSQEQKEELLRSSLDHTLALRRNRAEAERTPAEAGALRILEQGFRNQAAGEERTAAAAAARTLDKKALSIASSRTRHSVPGAGASYP